MASVSLCPLQGEGQPLPTLYPQCINAAASGTGAILAKKFLPLTREGTWEGKLQFSEKYGNRCLRTTLNL